MTSLDASPHRVFVDSSAFFALASTRDTHHQQAVSIMRRLAATNSELITSNFIRAEAHALLLTRLGRQAALQFLDSLNQGATALVRVTTGDEERAIAIIRRYEDKKFSFTDATSFTVMERLHLPSAFAFDRNFAQYGLQTLASLS